MDEIIQIAKGNPIPKWELLEQLQTVNLVGLSQKAEVLQSVTKDSVVFNVTINMKGDRILDLEYKVENKIKKFSDFFEAIVPQIDTNLTEVIKCKQVPLNETDDYRRQRLLEGLKNYSKLNKCVTPKVSKMRVIVLFFCVSVVLSKSLLRD